MAGRETVCIPAHPGWNVALVSPVVGDDAIYCPVIAWLVKPSEKAGTLPIPVTADGPQIGEYVALVMPNGMLMRQGLGEFYYSLHHARDSIYGYERSRVATGAGDD